MPFLTQGKTNWKYIIIVLMFAVIIGAGILGWINQQKIPLTELPKIEKEEKVEDETADWEIYRDEKRGFEFRYPKALGKKYIAAGVIYYDRESGEYRHHQWPPEIKIEPIDPDFVCEETEVQHSTIFNHSKYCILTTGEGVPGPEHYYYFRYITNRGNKQLTIKFTLNMASCGWWGIGTKEEEECKKEQKDFEDLGGETVLIDEILSTFRFLD